MRIKIVSFIILSLFSSFHVAKLYAQQPNIIFILCDDLGYGDLGVTGHPYIKSPNIDRIAQEGLRIENAYMSAAWCAPSRAALMSGLYPARYFNKTKELAVDKPSLTSILKEVGYTTAHYGKWHMGGKKAPAPSPADYAIDESFIANGHSGDHPTWDKTELKDPHWREKTTERYVDLTIEFIKKNQSKPFFINLWVYPTHSYIDPTPEMLEVYKDLKVDINDFKNPLQREFLQWISEQGDVQEAMRAYCSDVTELDNHVGRVMQTLVELELDQNTMIIFSSDNGPAPLGGARNDHVKRMETRPTLINCVGSSGPFRDRKISLNEGGTRVPFFVRWPAKIKPGSINHETVFGGIDLLPTLAALANASIPNGFDGKDLSAVWLGSNDQRPGSLFWNDRPGWSTLRYQQWKAHLQKKEFRLYDLSKDPSESNNVADKFPEIADGFKKQIVNWENSLPLTKKAN
ncbi:MAG: sulfatase-like hydrolase/transferase [Verrucomicrobiota bacterium]